MASRILPTGSDISRFTASLRVQGKVIGALLVASGGTGGVDINSFVGEAETSADADKRSLALSVLGEAALRLGLSSPLKPEFFLKHLGEEYDRFSMTTAMALGRAAAGNPEVYLPVVLQGFQGASVNWYHSTTYVPSKL